MRAVSPCPLFGMFVHLAATEGPRAAYQSPVPAAVGRRRNRKPGICCPGVFLHRSGDAAAALHRSAAVYGNSSHLVMRAAASIQAVLAPTRKISGPAAGLAPQIILN